ncbi:MAG TPA: hypothetical protein VLQ48_08815 [Chloroflexia bacterium]|nr:hypothetical protein [Chloroflexia bacterium]
MATLADISNYQNRTNIAHHRTPGHRKYPRQPSQRSLSASISLDMVALALARMGKVVTALMLPSRSSFRVVMKTL